MVETASQGAEVMDSDAESVELPEAAPADEISAELIDAYFESTPSEFIESQQTALATGLLFAGRSFRSVRSRSDRKYSEAS